MRKFALLVSFVFASLMVARVRAADAPPTLDVWPTKAPGVNDNAPAEQWDKQKVTNVTHPTLTVFAPAKEKNTGVAVIVAPGGGYKALMMDYEGADVARWLSSIGITGIVLKYRVPAPEGTPRWMPALQDAQRALSLVRSKAKEWNIDEHRVGILGFSAGGHLAAAASTNYEKRAYEPIDAVDGLDCKPDFAVLIYPGGIVSKGTEKLSDEIRVTTQTPRAFIVMADNDPVNSENAARYYLALKAAKVPAELHIYAAGGHGFGMRPSDKPASTWPQRCEEWMRNQKILPPVSGATDAK